MKLVAIFFAILSGGCLLVIQLRKNLPLFGSIISDEVNEKLDSTDKKLAIVALISFMVCIAFLLTSLW